MLQIKNENGLKKHSHGDNNIAMGWSSHEHDHQDEETEEMIEGEIIYTEPLGSDERLLK